MEKTVDSPKVPTGNVSNFRRRKAPTQQRARSTVDAIFKAATELASAHGFRHVTTTQIAQRVGVSIGSLYQYFPNKEAIFLSLYEEASTSVAEEVKVIMLDVVNRPANLAIPALIKGVIRLYKKNRLTLLQLVAEMPELKLLTRPLAAAHLIRSSMQAYLQLHIHHGSKKEMLARLFLMESAVVYTIERYVAERPEGVSDQQFAREMSRMSNAYLIPLFADQR